MTIRQVLIVEAGGDTAWIDFLKRTLEGAAEVEIVKTFEDALKRLEKGGVTTLIFLSNNMISKARNSKKQYPRLKVVFFADIVLQEEIIIIGKGWRFDPEVIRLIVV